jgi:tellurite resistance protein
MLAGVELGFSPMTALGAFDVIQGRAAAKAITLRALVQSKGHEIIMVESTGTRCRMKGRRANSTEWQAVTWTIDRAKDLGLTGKHNWKAQPAAMLIARATSEICRLVASDAILGIAGGYSSEEIADGGTVAYEVQEQTLDATPTGTRKMSRKAPAPAAPPELAEDVQDAEVVEEPETGETITKAQSKALHASFNDAGIAERDQRLDYCRNLIGRDLDTSNDLTKAEASRIIDALKADAEAGEQS